VGNDEHTLTVAVYPIGPDEPVDESDASADQGGSFPLLLVRFERPSLPAASPQQTSGAELQGELDRLHAQLRLTTQGKEAPEDLEAANEELRSMNQELHVMNEELHTKNHELATRREELKATNEELKATNRQLREKMEEIEETNSALETLMAATQITTFFLDHNLHIQRYTPQNTDLFNVRPTDVGRPLSDLARRFSDDGLLDDVRHVLDTRQTLDREIRPDEDTWLLTRIRPYSQDTDRGDGVVLTFVDVTKHRTLERELVNATEKVRREIGQELHDILSSDLTAIAIKIDSIAQRLDEARPEEAEALQEVIDTTREAAEKSRTLSHELVPMGLQEEHLAAALESLCNEQEDLSELSCVFVGDREEPLPKKKETAMQLYRIALEAIVNAREHANPSEIQVDLRRRDGNLVLRVRDDGTGLPDSLDEVEGLGIRTMRYRANLIGASLTLETTAGDATVVRCTLPLGTARAE
jgi:two-component system CheB/CheR fusion protein